MAPLNNLTDNMNNLNIKRTRVEMFHSNLKEVRVVEEVRYSKRLTIITLVNVAVLMSSMKKD